MVDIQPGQSVKIPCKVQPGPFPGEKLITLDSLAGPISGFVPLEAIEDENEGKGYIIGKVVSVGSHAIKVLLQGSFFTTNGLADISRELALAA